MIRPLSLALCTMLAFACSKKNDDPAQPAPTGGGGGTPCTYTVGPWTPWLLGIRTREVTAEPTGCTGTAPTGIQYHSCHTGNKAFLKVSNLSSNPYRVTITGPTSVPVFDLPGGFMRDSIMVNTGTYGMHSLQLSGYVLYPSEFNATANANTKCQVNTWSFP